MRIRLVQSVLKDFKCYQDKTVDFQKGNVTEIKGRNEEGKTTIADAFYDTFIKRDYALNSNPSIRPKGREDSIPTVTHVIDVDGKEVIVTKIQKMSRSKSDENKVTLTNSYEVNAVPKNETTFNAYFEEMGLDFKKFQALSHLDAFLGQKQDDMRKVIFELGSEKSDLDIALLNEDTADVAQLLQNYKLEEIEAMNKSTIKKINDSHGSKGELTEKAIVSKQELLVEMDVAEVELQKKAINEQIANIDKKIADSSSQGKEVSELGQKELQLEFDKNDISRKAHDEIRNQKRAVELSLDEANSKFDKCISSINRNERLTKEKQELIIYAENKRQELLKEWQAVTDSIFDGSRWVFDDSSTVCSMCGQTLPSDKIEDLKATFEVNKTKAKEKFSVDKKASLSKIETNGMKQKDIIVDYTKEIVDLEKEITSLRAESDKYLEEKNSYKAKLDAFTDTVDLSQNEEYQKKLSEIKTIQDKLASLENNEDYIAELKAQKTPLLEELSECDSKIAKFSRNSDIEEQIAELKERRIGYEQARADAEKILFQCREVSMRKDDLLAGEINSHFQFVKWKLWDYQKNGEKKSICEPYFLEDGIDKTFHDSMSGGTKIRAKIDICYSLQKFFNMYLPIFVDEASEIDRDKVPEVDTQVILLSRADCDLTIG